MSTSVATSTLMNETTTRVSEVSDVSGVTSWREAGAATTGGPAGEEDALGPITWDDATWILTSSFIIFTMQSGFGLLEAGSVSTKNEVNIMVKNAVDVIFGGLTYWMFGFGLSFGNSRYSNPFVGIGDFFVDTMDSENMGLLYSTYIFQLSFATTATTIVSGAMAERTKLTAYIVFSLLNTVIYSIPAHWIWASNGFLRALGALDVAGASAVHLCGGTAGLVATLMLKPRIGRYDGDFRKYTGNLTSCVVGMFMLWWGWLGFNCGSTFGISGGKWKLAAKSAVTTINSSIGGGVMGIALTYIINKRKYIVPDIVNAVLGALVSITASCAVVRPWEALVIGMVGGSITIAGAPIFDKLHIDDPVGAISVHGLCGIWGMLSAGFFVSDDPLENINRDHVGILKGGGPYLLGVQTLACTVVMAWAGLTSFTLLLVIDRTIGLRMSATEELQGADFAEHNITVHYSVETQPAADEGQGTNPPAKIYTRRGSFGFVTTDTKPSHSHVIDSSTPTTVSNGVSNNSMSTISISTIDVDATLAS